MPDWIPITVVNITGVYCADPKLVKRLADEMKPHFHDNTPMRLSFSRARVLTPEFVEKLFDTLYKRHGVKVGKLVKLVSLNNEGMQHLQRQGFTAARDKYEARKQKEIIS